MLLIKIVNKELIKVENWLNRNKLSLNLAKIKYMLIKPNIKNFTNTNNFIIHVSGVKLERGYSTKYLGLILDEDLPENLSCIICKKKLAQGIGLMAKMRKYLSNKNLLSLYYDFFYSYVLHCILFLLYVNDLPLASNFVPRFLLTTPIYILLITISIFYNNAIIARG